jgi:acetyl esterase/lipase
MSSIPHESFPLWDIPAPGALGHSTEEHVPTLTPYAPANGRATGAAVIVCPGGSYGMLADHEGRDYALWLNDRGIAAFVLKYRLGSHGYRHPIMVTDAARAIRTVRHRAAAWSLDPQRIGIMGSSAGGHLVSTAITHFDAGESKAPDPIDRISSRPNLGILCYPVISMGPLAHEESRRNLLGTLPSPELVTLLSSELQVKPSTPPCFIWHTQDDDAVKVENALAFASALQAQGVSFSLHIYPSGPHGLGLGVSGYQPGDTRPLHPWTRELEGWLKERHFVCT